MAERIDRFYESVRAAGYDFALINRRENMRYLTGYTGEGCLLVGSGFAAILTNFIYIEQAELEAGWCRVIKIGGEVKLTEALGLLVMPTTGAKVAAELDFITVNDYEELRRGLPGVGFGPLGGIPERMRRVKDADEIQKIREACDIACRAFENMLGWIKPGMSEKRIQTDLNYEMQKLGSEREAFDTIVCSGPNGSLPHAVPGERVIQPGDLVTFDFGAQRGGYKSDMTRTIAVGKISSGLKNIYDTVLSAQLAAIDAIRPGVKCSDIDAVARDLIDAAYPGAFGHSLGHGVGLDVHESPGLSTRDTSILEAGHVVTIEPGIYIPGLGGCRIEDMGAVTESGLDNMIDSPKHLIAI